jgi:Outer membrane protein beta-barrel domain
MKRRLSIHSILPMTVAGLFFTTAAKAQFKPGTLMVGTTVGSIGYSSATSDYGYEVGTARSTGTNTFTFSTGPQVGVFLTPNLVFGGSLSYTLSHSTATTTTTSATNTVTGSKTTTTTNTLSIGPLLRYYFAGLKSNNWFYGQINGAVGPGTGSSSGTAYTATTTSTSTGKTNGIFNWNAGASLGMTHFFYKRIGMDFSIGYSFSHAHSDNNNSTYSTKISNSEITSSTNNYSLNTGTNTVTLGVGFHLFL